MIKTGTNFYVRYIEQCSECGHKTMEKTHLGKKSHGWKFHLDYRAFYGTSKQHYQHDWKKLIPDGIIQDEYGRYYTKQEFIDYIDSCQDKAFDEAKRIYKRKSSEYIDINGYIFIEGSWS